MRPLSRCGDSKGLFGKREADLPRFVPSDGGKTYVVLCVCIDGNLNYKGAESVT